MKKFLLLGSLCLAGLMLAGADGGCGKKKSRSSSGGGGGGGGSGGSVVDKKDTKLSTAEHCKLEVEIGRFAYCAEKEGLADELALCESDKKFAEQETAYCKSPDAAMMEEVLKALKKTDDCDKRWDIYEKSDWCSAEKKEEGSDEWIKACGAGAEMLVPLYLCEEELDFYGASNAAQQQAIEDLTAKLCESKQGAESFLKDLTSVFKCKEFSSLSAMQACAKTLRNAGSCEAMREATCAGLCS
ncbi:MAG: hypothetical protein FWC28_07095 [Proteobacteria bacterium]|nr:hypothetical protein [Cystobacterineae bacterium]MCL2258706.1 hypothetical protein [Cystobacterineae bacterium]MCL2314996.1 hypothetical protein [Pseudomonadota bacterium]